MKTAILSDIHGNDVAFEAVEKDMKTRGINAVVFLGNLVALGPQPLEVYNRLKGMFTLARIKGSTDAWLDDAMIDVLPFTARDIMMLDYYDYMTHHLSGEIMDDIISFNIREVIQLGHYQAVCIHGTPIDVKEGLLIDDSIRLSDQLKEVSETVVLSGHTHKAWNRTEGIYRLLNPGTVGHCNYGDDTRASYTMVDTTSGFHVEQIQVTYDVDRVLAIATERAMPNLDDYRNRMIRFSSDIL